MIKQSIDQWDKSRLHWGKRLVIVEEPYEIPHPVVDKPPPVKKKVMKKATKKRKPAAGKPASKKKPVRKNGSKTY